MTIATLSVDLSTPELIGIVALAATIFKFLDSLWAAVERRIRERNGQGDATRRDVLAAIERHDKNECQRIDNIHKVLDTQNRLMERITQTQGAIEKSLAVLSALQQQDQNSWRNRDIRGG